jgi:hypothetical protein
MYDWATCVVVKRSYSLNPWRIETAEGRQTWRWAPYPGGHLPPIEEPICYPRKRDAVAALAELRRSVAAQ